ncbi:MAG: hypothetical protein D3908_04515 [Candidatus Electrothrix sp. AUS4]|nr:hypothetical protein [Candidatus Electrothrix sp. AUS4]
MINSAVSLSWSGLLELKEGNPFWYCLISLYSIRLTHCPAKKYPPVTQNGPVCLLCSTEHVAFRFGTG